MPKTAAHEGPTLTQALAAIGFGHREGQPNSGGRIVFDIQTGRALGNFTAHEAWERLTRKVTLTFDGAEGHVTTLGEFTRDNADGIEGGEVDIDAIRAALRDSGTYHGPGYTIAKAES